MISHRERKKLIRRASEIAFKESPAPKKDPGRIKLMGRGGSDRHFYRFEYERDSVLVLIQSENIPEFESYILIGNFLREQGIGVPDFYGIDRKAGILVMEDLGDCHLQDVLSISSLSEQERLYKLCMECLIRFQTFVTLKMHERNFLSDSTFGFGEFMDETEYFHVEFIEKFCPIVIEKGWKEERSSLARILADQPPVFMHRDFQSSNILIKDDVLRIIDFQSAHRGPGLYDTVSILKDPYNPLPAEKRLELLKILYTALHQEGAVPGSFDQFHRIFIFAGIQRNLQSLAAYAKLGYAMGKEHFLHYIPAGLRLLKEGVKSAGCFPAIEIMVERIEKNLEEDGFYSSTTL